MQGLRFGPTFTFPTSGLLLTDLAMLYSWKGEWLVGVLVMLREFEYLFVVLSAYSTLV